MPRNNIEMKIKLEDYDKSKKVIVRKNGVKPVKSSSVSSDSAVLALQLFRRLTNKASEK